MLEGILGAASIGAGLLDSSNGASNASSDLSQGTATAEQDAALAGSQGLAQYNSLFNQGQSIFANQTGQALNNIQFGNSTAEATQQPAANAGYNALDAYMQALGLSTPVAGSAATAQTNAQYQQQLNTLQQTGVQFQSAAQAAGIPSDSPAWQSLVSALGNENPQMVQSALSALQQQYPTQFSDPGFAAAANGIQTAATNIGATNATRTSQAAAGNTVATNQQTSPYSSQLAATNTLYGNLLGTGGTAGNTSAQAALASTPGYQFAVQQSMSALNNEQASMGLLQSGNTAANSEALASGLASQNYNNVVGQTNTALGTLQGEQQNYIGNLATAAGQTAPGISNLAATQANNGTEQAAVNMQYGSQAAQQYQTAAQNTSGIVANSDLAQGQLAASGSAAQAQIANGSATSQASGLTGLGSALLTGNNGAGATGLMGGLSSLFSSL